MFVASGFKRRALVAALIAIYGTGLPVAHANPGGAQVANGQATLVTQGSKLTVTNSPGTIINWQSFSIGSGETTYFQQQSAASAVLNRVQAQNPSLKSQIDGTLGSNGRVFLINPNGIVFGAGSLIDTQGFVASTLNMNDEDFKAGKFKFFGGSGAGSIEAQGRISSGAGDVYLVAPNIGVDGKAVISSVGGNIVLAAGEMVEITGRNLNDIKFAVQSKDNKVINLGTLTGGAVGVFAGTLSHSGIIRAQGLVLEGGKIVLKASDGLAAIESGSRVDASGTQGGSVSVQATKILQDGNIRADGSDSMGGTVSLQADSRLIQTAAAKVTAQGVLRGGDISLAVSTDPTGSGNLFTSATIDASASSGLGGSITVTGRDLNFAAARISANGDAGGGNIRVGGGRAGQDNSLQNAQNVVANAASLFEASGRVNGDGGTVVVWAEGITRFAGNVEARGGANAGNGGLIEVSGKQETQFSGLANASAPQGNSGSFVLDPKNILIQTPTVVPGVSVELLDPNPGSGDLFGQNVQVLSGGNNNILILNPLDDLGGTNAGAAYLYDGLTGALISHLRGGSAGDQIGSSGYQTLSDGSIAIRSPNWSNGVATGAGAITWTNGTTGVSGVVSGLNSLVGSHLNDGVGSGTLSSLAGGKHYFVTSAWNGNAGAVTWLNPAALPVGTVSSANSLVGSQANDNLGSGGIVQTLGNNLLIKSPSYNGSAGAVTWANGSNGIYGTIGSEINGNSIFGNLPGDGVGSGGTTFLDYYYGSYYNYGNFAVISPNASNPAGSISAAGAITFGTYSSGFLNPGPVSAVNSLVGSSASDQLGSGGISLLYNPANYSLSNFLILSPNFNGGAGAVTWASGVSPVTGTVGSASNGNSIFGTVAADAIGSGGTQILSNNSIYNFLVKSPHWENSGADAGAITWGDQASGFANAGAVSSSNSLVGSNGGDQVGSGGIFTLNNGNYLVRSPNFNGGAGAVTWALGTNALYGTIGSETHGNSIVGSVSADAVGSTSPTGLNYGNFVVTTSSWGGGKGAVTWGDQYNGFSAGGAGAISASNSLVGTLTSDQVGGGTLLVLNSGGFVVGSPSWNGNRGAATFSDGTAPLTGTPDVVTAGGSSIFGSTVNDRVGLSLQALGNGNYVVLSTSWGANLSTSPFGAVTWGSQTTGFASPGAVSSTNSLVGGANDQIGSGGITAMYYSGNYLIKSPSFNGGGGAVTFASGTAPITGTIATTNSISGASGENVGNNITLLSNSGNFVVRSTAWGGGKGAVTWGDQYTGFTATGVGLVSSSNSLVGSSVTDSLGSGGITELQYSGNYLIKSPLYNGNGGALTFGSSSAPVTGTIPTSNSIYGAPNDNVGNSIDENYYTSYFVVRSTVWGGGKGAVTWGDVYSGFSSPQIVSAANSLVGNSVTDGVGSGGTTFLNNGASYLIKSPNWSGGLGAVTWAQGGGNITGVIGLEGNGNSIVGSTAGDSVGSGGIDILYNGNFLVRSPLWDNASATNAGAVTWGSQSTGFTITGPIANTNSLVGTHNNDSVGSTSVTTLYASGMQLLRSASWDSNKGAVTWFDPGSTIVGDVSAANSLVGSTAGDAVGANVTTTGSQYVVFSPLWDDYLLSVADAGAVTFASANSGVVGQVSAVNSLVGSHAGDQVGNSLGFTGFVSGGSVIRSSNWDGGRGALTYVAAGATPAAVLDATNSLVGNTANDSIGSGSFSNYTTGKVAVFSPSWNNGAATLAGAVTWLDTTAPNSGFTGTVTSANSLVGSTTNDQVGSTSSVQYINGTLFAVRTASWDNGAATNAGAITWVNPAAPPTGPVSASNSLVGSNTNDAVGGSTSFTTGSGYIVTRNGAWNGNRGAVTWMSTAAPVTGSISSANSLIGANANDQIGAWGVSTLSNGNYYVLSGYYNNNAGAVTIGSASAGISGVVSGTNSLVGLAANDGIGQTVTFLSNSRILVKAANADSGGFTNNGRVFIYAGGAGGAGNLGSQLFTDSASANITITPAQITAMLNNGTSVLLQANNDITLDVLSDIFANNTLGNGGNLTLQAGRSVLINSNITTDNGNITIIANDRTANGVSSVNRDAGTAEITMANGTLLDAGTGNVDFQLRDGAGHSGASDSASYINVRSITANNLSIRTDYGGLKIGDSAATLPSDIKLTGNADVIAATKILIAGGAPGAFARLSADQQITIDPPSLELRPGQSFATIINPTRLYPIKLIVSDCINCNFTSPFEISGTTLSNSNAINAALLSLNLNPLDDIGFSKKSKGDIEVDAGETCN